MKGLLGAVTLAALCAACAPSGGQADTLSLTTVDTLKPAPTDTGASTTGGTSTGATTTTATTATKAGTSTKASQRTPGTASKTPPRDTTTLGHDRAIQPNTTDSRFRLPVIDTTKKPPGGA